MPKTQRKRGAWLRLAAVFLGWLTLLVYPGEAARGAASRGDTHASLDTPAAWLQTAPAANHIANPSNPPPRFRTEARAEVAKLAAAAWAWITLVRFAIILLAAPVVWYVAQEVSREVLIIDPFSVPKTFDDAGLTSQVMANRIGSAISRIEAEVKTSLKKDQLGFSYIEGTIPEIEIPGTKIGLKTAIDLARSVLRRYPRRISGDIVFPTRSPADAQAQPATVTVYMIQGRNQGDAISAAVDPNDLDGLVEQAARLVLEQVNPYVLASHLAAHREGEKAARILRTMAQNPAEDLPHRSAAWNLLGLLLQMQRRYDEAIAKYQAAIALNPKNVDAFNNWGFALYGQRKYDEAVAKYRRAIKLDSKYAYAYSNWGLALLSQQRFDDSIAESQRALELDPNIAAAYNNWGFALYNQQRFDEAITRYQQALEVDPAFAQAYSNWGLALLEKRKFDEAIAKFQRAVELDPNLAQAYNNWGYALSNQQKFDEAIAKYQLAIGIEPAFSEAYNNIGLALYGQGKFDDAIVQFQRAAELNPSFVTAYVNWGSALNQAKHFAEAIAKFQQAIEIDPGNASAYNGWGNTLFNQEIYDQAIAKFQRAIDLDPRYAAAYANLSTVLSVLGKDSEAAQNLAKAKDLGFAG